MSLFSGDAIELFKARWEVTRNNLDFFVNDLLQYCSLLEALLDKHKRYHGKVGCPGGEDCYVCVLEERTEKAIKNMLVE